MTMTQNRKLAKAARALSDATGKSYMQARRELEAGQADAEPYYRLSAAEGIERIEGENRWKPHRREAMWVADTRGAYWGYGGSGPIATAKGLLDDACGVDADLWAAREFARDVLVQLNMNLRVERVTVAEVRAWHDERMPELVARGERRAEQTLAEALAAEIDELEDGSKVGWWLGQRRAEHPPRLPKYAT
jgi:hypothetical protein